MNLGKKPAVETGVVLQKGIWGITLYKKLGRVFTLPSVHYRPL
jgi:hypothetical protein